MTVVYKKIIFEVIYTYKKCVEKKIIYVKYYAKYILCQVFVLFVKNIGSS